MSERTDALLGHLADGEWHKFTLYVDGFKPAHFHYLRQAGLVNTWLDGNTASAIATDAGLAHLEHLRQRAKVLATSPPVLVPPPMPYSLVESKLMGSNGRGHLYLADANGRKIAALWGGDGEKIALGEMIVAMSKASPP